MNPELLLALTAAFILGISKGGIKGLGILVVTLTALAYGAKNSTGILLPLLMTGDVLAVIYFKKHIKWQYIKQFLPSMIVGVLVAVFIGNNWDEAIFKKALSGIILFSVGYMFWMEYRPLKSLNVNWKFSSLIGFAAGFTTMIGNLAGPFANLYFLATRIPKKELVATSAWVFFFINIFKLPFHIFVWKTIRWDTIHVNFSLIPAVIIGFFIGTRLLGLFNENSYRKFILVVTAIGGVLILLK